MEDHLEEARLVAEDLAACDFGVPRHADFVRHLGARERLLGGADHRDLRHGVDPDREVCRHRGRFGAEGVTRGQTTLLARGGREARISDHVACGKDVRHVGAELRVHAHAAAIVHQHAGAIESEVRRGAQAADGEERHVGHDLLPRLEPERGARRPVLVHLEPIDGLPEAQAHVAASQLVQKLINDLAVDELERAGTAIHQRDRDAERREHGRILDADDARANDGEGARERGQRPDVVAREDHLPVRHDAREGGGHGARADQDVGGGHLASSGGPRDGEAVRVEEFRDATEHVDSVPLELIGDDGHLVGHDLPDPFDELRRRGSLRERARPPGPRDRSGNAYDGLAQRLARYGPDLETGPAHDGTSLDDGHPPPELGGLHRAALTGRARAQTEQVIVERGVAHGGRLGLEL